VIEDLIRIHQQTLRRKDGRLTPFMVGKAHDIVAALEELRARRKKDRIPVEGTVS
jgi:hypothetical protein